MRTVVVGNSGSGKTWLAKRLGEKTGATIVHLDDLFWEPGGFTRKRSADEVARLIELSGAEADWIAEGVYGDLVGQFAPFAHTLLWLDLPWSVCKRRIESRASESVPRMSEEAESGLRDLVVWAEAYYSRVNSCSEAAHLDLFSTFPRERLRLCSEEQVREYLS